MAEHGVGAVGVALVVGVGQQHVLRLDVTVDHAARVRMCECVAERDPDLEHLLVRERVGVDQLGERGALDEFGDQVEVVLVSARLVQRDDRRVGEARSGLRLARGALAILVGRQRDALDGDFAAQQLVVCAPHDPETAGAESFA